MRTGRRSPILATALLLAAGLLAISGISRAQAGTAPDSPARLSVAGPRVLDPAGHPIVLRGYNWGAWGTTQPQDAADNLAQGANSVRIPLRWWGDWKGGVDSRDPAAPGHIDPAHLAVLDRTVAWAGARHLWIVLFVDSNHGQGAGGRTDNFWTDPAMKQQFVQVWQFLVNRYKHTRYIGAWEILPEPMAPGVSDADVKAFYDSIIPDIRAIDRRTPIVVGPNHDYSLKHLDAAYTTIDKNIIYTGDYFIFDQPLNRMPDITGFVGKYQAPVWINQVGIPSGDPDSQQKARTVLGALNAANVGWAWWTYRIAGSHPDDHGIYYVDPADPSAWVCKTDWLTLVGDFLRQPVRRI